MKKVLIFFVCLFLLISLTEAKSFRVAKVQTIQPGDFSKSFWFEGRLRYYEYHVPSGCSNPIPVVLVFHGGSSNPAAIRDDSRMDLIADEHKFIAVYPQGTKRDIGFIWNDGRLFADTGQPSTVNDVGFVSAVLDKLAVSYQIDRNRVYSCGYSNGAQFCYRLAKELSNEIKAVACVAGHRGPDDLLPPPPIPVPIMQFSGLLDTIAPYCGGEPSIDQPWITVLQPVPDVISRWVSFNGCSFIETIQINQAVKQDYGDVVLWTLNDAGHTLPGGPDHPLLEPILGPVNHDINASELMWEFFNRY